MGEYGFLLINRGQIPWSARSQHGYVFDRGSRRCKCSEVIEFLKLLLPLLIVLDGMMVFKLVSRILSVG